MKKIYLVDSENVGDVWVPLLVSAEQEDQVIVFYTPKSPHMSYENVRMLKETEREAEFIKCFEGNNALDFQLVSELGYRLNQDKECEYVIVSNDTGFDAVVRYWTRLEMPVRRLSGKECHKQVTQKNAPKMPVGEENATESEPQTAPFTEAVLADQTIVIEKDMDGEAALTTSESEVETNFQAMSEHEAENDSQSGSQAVAGKRQRGGTRGTAKKKSLDKAEVTAEEEHQNVPGTETASESATEEYPDTSEPAAEKEHQNASESAAVKKRPNKAEPAERKKHPDTSEPAAEKENQNASEAAAESEQQNESAAEDGCQDVLKELCCCIGKDNLADLHNALVMLLGEDAGKAKYQELKSKPEYALYWKELPVYSQEEKFNIYSRLVFTGSEMAEEDIPQDFSGFLWKANGKRKNLNSLRAALQGHYGKEKGMKYYSLFKSHIKIMNRM
jgi:hypothetical protein